ncbi:MAG: hypothetical protein M9958_12910 [Chitinophagales bacterium]|nr:hypothetical protein [Chitinophagales bacterium]
MRALKVFFTLTICVLTILYSAEAAIQKNPPKIDNNLEKDSKLMPCIKTLLDDSWMPSGSNLSKSAQGTLTVTNEGETKIFFNVILKTNTGKKGDPPIYLRFVKVAQLDIRKVLEYAKSGDEIYIEQYTIDGSQRTLCAPSSLTVT